MEAQYKSTLSRLDLSSRIAALVANSERWLFEVVLPKVCNEQIQNIIEIDQLLQENFGRTLIELNSF